MKNNRQDVFMAMSDRFGFYLRFLRSFINKEVLSEKTMYQSWWKQSWVLKNSQSLWEAMDPFILAWTKMSPLLDSNLGGREDLRNHEFSGETNNWSICQVGLLNKRQSSRSLNSSSLFMYWRRSVMAPLVAPPRLAAKPLVAKPNGDCNRYQMKGMDISFNL